MNNDLVLKIIEAASVAAGGALAKEIVTLGAELLKQGKDLVVDAGYGVYMLVKNRFKNENEVYERDFKQFEEDQPGNNAKLQEDISMMLVKDTKFRDNLLQMLDSYAKAVVTSSEALNRQGSRLAYANQDSIAIAGDVSGDVSMNQRTRGQEEQK